jgi:hypothetical protein
MSEADPSSMLEEDVVGATQTLRRTGVCSTLACTARSTVEHAERPIKYDSIVARGLRSQ